MTDMTKEARIKREAKRLTKQFAEIDEKNKTLAVPLIQNAAFMKATLEDLQEIVNEEGLIDEYQNGSAQHGMKQSAALQGYNTLVKNYNAVIKTLAQILLQAAQERGSTLGDMMAGLLKDE